MDAPKYYSTIKDSYEALYRREQEGKIAYLISIIKPRRGQKILDVGAGTGILEEKLPKLKIVALEPSDLSDILVDKKLKNVRLVRERIADFDYDAKFDVIFCITVLQDMSEEERGSAMEKMLKLCKSGGKVIVSVLNTSKIDLSKWDPKSSGHVENDTFYIFEKK